MSAPARASTGGRVMLPFSAFRNHGLLWLINRTVFHPRGFALALNVEDDGTVTGWKLIGDGTEPWHFSPEPDPDGWSEDAAFTAVETFLNLHRGGYDCGCNNSHIVDCPLVAAGIAEAR